MRSAIIIITLLTLAAATGCKTKQHGTSAATKVTENSTTTTAPIPSQPVTYGHTAHAVIYKTKADYTHYVPVTLTDDGSAIASYPAPGDLYYKGAIATPTKLANGYLLDNRGITPHSAFIKITYDDYAKLQEVPSLKELYKLVIDKAPFTEMYDLGERNLYEDATGSINSIIKGGRLAEYRKLL